jgi:thiamine kinase-like enzyme
MLERVYDAYGLKESAEKAIPFGSGLINATWKIGSGQDAFILQRINHNIFKSPEAIAYNINITGNYLHQHFPGYLFVKPLKTIHDGEIYHDADEGYFRLSPFINRSHTIDVVTNAKLAYEAAKQFGKLTKLLSGFNAGLLKITLPDFHNLSYRFLQFKEALVKGNSLRIKQSRKLIDLIFEDEYIVEEYEKIKIDPLFKLRVTHHDTKISNVLFDENNKGLCVIDLDTLMPGYFISDVGDMLRTYLSPVSEEEKDFSKIEVRDEYFINIAKGYLEEMHDELTPMEKNNFVYSGKFMIYMQALRFLTDHLNDDIYYGAKYQDQNFFRAGNQLILLQTLTKKEDELQDQVNSLGFYSG